MERRRGRRWFGRGWLAMTSSTGNVSAASRGPLLNANAEVVLYNTLFALFIRIHASSDASLAVPPDLAKNATVYFGRKPIPFLANRSFGTGERQRAVHSPTL